MMHGSAAPGVILPVWRPALFGRSSRLRFVPKQVSIFQGIQHLRTGCTRQMTVSCVVGLQVALQLSNAS
jgi:hypothetical protein